VNGDQLDEPKPPKSEQLFGFVQAPELLLQFHMLTIRPGLAQIRFPHGLPNNCVRCGPS
jgi:hypothetical protein